MFSRFMDWLDSQPPNRRRLYSVFLALLLLTLPCYAAGLFLLYFGTPPAPANPAPVMTAQPSATALTATPTATYYLRATVVVRPEPTEERREETEPVATPLLTPPGTVLADTPTPEVPLPPTLTEPPAATATEAATDVPTAEPTSVPATPEPPTSEPSAEPNPTEPPATP